MDFTLRSSRLNVALQWAITNKQQVFLNLRCLEALLKEYVEILCSKKINYFYFKKHIDGLIAIEALSKFGQLGFTSSPGSLIKFQTQFINSLLTNAHFNTLYDVYSLSDAKGVCQLSTMFHLLIADYAGSSEVLTSRRVIDCNEMMVEYVLSHEKLLDSWFELLKNNYQEMENLILSIDPVLISLNVKSLINSPLRYKLYPLYNFAKVKLEKKGSITLIKELVNQSKINHQLSNWLIESSDLTSYFIKIFTSNPNLDIRIKQLYIEMIIGGSDHIKSLLINDIIEYLLSYWSTNGLEVFSFIKLFIKYEEDINDTRINQIISNYLAGILLDGRDTLLQDLYHFNTIINYPNFKRICKDLFTPISSSELIFQLSLESVHQFNESLVYEVHSTLQDILPSPVKLTSIIDNLNKKIKFLYHQLLMFFGNKLEENKELISIFETLNIIDNGSILITTNSFIKIIRFLFDCYQHYIVIIHQYSPRTFLVNPSRHLLKSLDITFKRSTKSIDRITLQNNILIFEKFYITMQCSAKLKQVD